LGAADDRVAIANGGPVAAVNVQGQEARDLVGCGVQVTGSGHRYLRDVAVLGDGGLGASPVRLDAEHGL